MSMIQFVTEIVVVATCFAFASYADAGDQYVKAQDTIVKAIDNEAPAAEKNQPSEW
jgi:hypothetical protein